MLKNTLKNLDYEGIKLALKKNAFLVTGGIVVFLLLYDINHYNYLLFHSIAEIFSIIVAFAIFTIAWNSRQFLGNNFLLFIGISYFFIGGIDLLHTFSYKGMDVFSEGGTNLATQLWVAARYLQSVSFLAALLLAKRRFRPVSLFVGYAAIFVFLVASIFYLKIFPVSYVEGEGLTVFKKSSEYLISFILFASLVLLYAERKRFEKNIFLLLFGSITVTILSELTFAFYSDPFGIENFIGHILKIAAFYLIYKAIVETGFGKPYHFLFRDLKRSQERYSSLVEYSPEAIAVYSSGVFLYMNPAGLALFGAESRKDIVGKKTLDFIHPMYKDSIRSYVQKLQIGRKAEPLKEFKILRLDGEVRYVEAVSSEITYQDKDAVQAVIRDITDRKRKEEELARSNEFNKTLLNTIPFAMDIVDEKGNILFMSRKFEEEFGPSAIGKKCWELYKDDKKQCENCLLKKGIKIGKTDDIDIHGVFGGKIFKIIHTGMVFEGKKAIMEIFRDITEQKSIEKITEDARIYAENIVDTIRQPLVVLDADLKVVSANWFFYYSFRFLKEQTVEKPFFEIYNRYWDIPTLNERLKKVIEQSIPFRDLEISHVFPAAGRKTMLFSARQVYQAGTDKPRLLLAIKDVTEKKQSEQALEESESKYRFLTENTKDIIWILNPDTMRFTYISPSVKQMRGFTVEEILSKPVTFSVKPEEAENLKKSILKHRDEFISGKNQDTYYTGYLEQTCRDGSTVSTEVISKYYRNEKTGVIEVHGVTRDITERRRAEERIKDRERRYRNIFDNASDAVVTIDMSDKIVSWNRSAEKMFGWKAEEAIGKDFQGLVVPENLREERAQFINDAFVGKKTITGIETMRLRKDGIKIYVSLTFSPIVDASGKIVGLSGIIRDITARKENEKRLKLHAQKLEKMANDLKKFQLAVSNASDHIIITDTDGMVLYANKAAEDITGYLKKEMIGNKAGVIWGKQMPVKFYENLWNTIKEDKKIFIGELVNRRKNGEKYDAELRVSPILNENKEVMFFVAIERDITKEKEIDRAKTEFVSVASHELRTPLAGISLSVEMLLDSVAGDMNSEQKKYLKEIYQDIKGMAALIGALLNVSRIETRTLLVEPEPNNLREIAEAVIKELSPQTKSRNIKVKAVYDKTIPVIDIDRNLMRIIMQNLFSNAIKYTPPGGKVVLEIRKEQRHVVVKVADTGLGIPADEQDKIFTKMFRARNASDIKTDGIGLGLYITKSIVEQCGGKIWFKSEQNKGTAFFVAIPLEGMRKKI